MTAPPTPKPKLFNVTRWLNKHKGGNWKYDGSATWWCDDKVRHMSRVCMDSSRDDGGGPVGYYLYGGSNPGWVHFTETGQ